MNSEPQVSMRTALRDVLIGWSTGEKMNQM